MVSNIIIGVDIDGVIANFNHSFKRVLVETSGRDLFGPNWTEDDIRTWYYDINQYGYTKEESKAAWNSVWESSIFWRSLSPYRDTVQFLFDLKPLSDTIYFITQRKGVDVKAQTESWLKAYGWGSAIPTVLISGDKGGCCKSLGITHYIDDKTENCQDVKEVSPSTHVTMLAKGWNHPIDGVSRVFSVREFIKEIEACQQT